MFSGTSPIRLLLIPILAFCFSGCGSEEARARQSLRSQGIEVSLVNLYDALERGDEQLALALLESGITPNEFASEKRSALSLAAESGSTRVAWKLLPGDCSELPTDAEGLNVLVHAARMGETWLVKELLERQATPDFELPSGGTLIAECMNEGRNSITGLLLDYGADVESKDESGERLISLAARSGQTWLVKKLLNLGAQVSASKDSEDHLVHVVAESGRPELINLLAEKGEELAVINRLGESPVHIAIGSGSFDIIRPLFSRGVSIDAPDGAGSRPLHLAVMRRDPLSIDELLQLGADPNKVDDDGLTPLDFAVEMRDYELAVRLLNYGAEFRKDLLYQSVIEQDRDLIDFLLSNGANPNSLGYLSNDTPLAASIRNNDHWTASRLLKAGALPNSIAREGQTNFHLAMALLDRPMIKLLLKHGADPNLPFYDKPSQEFLELIKSPNIARWSLKKTRNFRPIFMAADSGDLELTKLLISYGADPNHYTLGGGMSYWRPISWASRRSDVPMMQILLGRNPEEKGRWARIDLSKQRAWVYDQDKEIYTTRVSTGKAGYRTRTGDFVITNRYRHWNSTLYGSSMPYFQRFSCSDFGFHQGYVPGYPASHGCVRVPWDGAKKLWELLSLGDVVEIVP